MLLELSRFPTFIPLCPAHPFTQFPPPFMSMGRTYKFFGFSTSYTILNLPLSALYWPFMLLTVTHWPKILLCAGGQQGPSDSSLAWRQHHVLHLSAQATPKRLKDDFFFQMPKDGGIPFGQMESSRGGCGDGCTTKWMCLMNWTAHLKIDSLTNGAGRAGQLHVKMKLDHQFIPYTEINSR